MLANWVASPDNPLTSRVMANRLWQYHFGRGIVRSPNNFGLQGDAPTHPELLDWLAGEFVARGWSMKAMHRLIMTSSTYRMAATGSDPNALAADPRNDLMWRFDLRRLTAEELHGLDPGVKRDAEPEGVRPESVSRQSPRRCWLGNQCPARGGTRAVPKIRPGGAFTCVKRSLRLPILEASTPPSPTRPARCGS